MPSDVYYSGMRCKGPNETAVHKLRKLFDFSGIAQTISKGDTVAVKIHLGTGGNQRHIRPQHLRVIIEKIKETGGKPFVTDSTGIDLTSENGTAESMLRNAAARGFVPEVVGAPIIVADAPKGLHGVKVAVDGLRLKEVVLAPAIAECDSLISVAHAKGHPRTGFAASLKNLGVGCATKSGKAPIHLAKKPSIDLEKCNDCGVCFTFCPVGAIVRVNGRPKIIHEQCEWGCGCWTICPTQAITKWFDMDHPSNEEMILREIDVAKATVDQIGPEKCGYFNLAYDVTPHCDCVPYGDVPMVPDVGMFASKDPVACDMATADAIINSPGIPGSAAEELNVMARGSDKFSALTDWPPFSNFKRQGGTKYWRTQFDAASRLGIGSCEYHLIEL